MAGKLTKLNHNCT